MRNPEPISILLVEDNEDDIILVKEALEDSKLLNLIHVSRDGDEALAFLRKEPPNEDVETPGLVLMDIKMPNKDGLETLAEMKADPRLAALPVAMLTVSSADEDIISSYTKGACSYVRKPVSFDKLKDIIKHFELYWTIVAVVPTGKK